MISNIIIKEPDSYEPVSTVKGFYKSETPKSVLIKHLDSRSFWCPKVTINSTFNQDETEEQEFIIDDWILRKHHLI